MSEMTGRERLMQALQARRGVPLELLSKAMQGWYDEFGVNQHAPAQPIMALVHDLLQAGMPDLATLAREGAFDASRAESDAWAVSAEGLLAEQEYGRMDPRSRQLRHMAAVSPELTRTRRLRPPGRG